MSKFTPLVKRTYEFQGDSISVSFRRLTRKHVLGFMPKVIAAQHCEGAEQLQAQNEMLNDLVDLLPQYVEEFTGLRDTDGNAVQFDTVVSEIFFIDLVTEIGTDLMNESMVMDGKEAKNG
jgi:hypothetical protein